MEPRALALWRAGKYGTAEIRGIGFQIFRGLQLIVSHAVAAQGAARSGDKCHAARYIAGEAKHQSLIP